MKCKNCNGTGNIANGMWLCCECEGTGEVEVVGDSVTDVCDKCGGTGFFCEMRMGDVCTLGSPCPYQEPLTNEEWLEQASTEEKAKLLSKLCKFIYNCGKKGSIPKFMYEEDFVQWLKEKH